MLLRDLGRLGLDRVNEASTLRHDMMLPMQRLQQGRKADPGCNVKSILLSVVLTAMLVCLKKYRVVCGLVLEGGKRSRCQWLALPAPTKAFEIAVSHSDVSSMECTFQASLFQAI